MMKRFLLICLCIMASLPGMAQKGSSSQNRRDRLQREIEILDGQIKENTRKSNSALSTLNLVKKKVDSRKQLVDESDKALKVLDDSISVKQRQIDSLQRKVDTMAVYYSRLVRNAYKNRDAKLWYMYILASSSFSQASRRYAYLRSMSTQMNAQARAIKEVQAELEAERSKVESMRSEAKKVRDVRAGELNRLQKDQKESEALISQLKRDKTRYQKQLAEKRRQVEALNRELGKAISSAVGSASKTGSKTSTKVDEKLSNEFASNKGRLPWPVSGVVVEGFGQHYHPVYKNVKLPFNNGVNVAVDPGTAVRAVFNGTVKQVIVMPGYNQCVLVQHGAYFTFYCKLQSVSVKAGEKVATGQQIGVVDTIDGETQLHFQLWSGKNPQNPENWLQ